MGRKYGWKATITPRYSVNNEIPKTHTLSGTRLIGDSVLYRQ